MHWIGKGFSGMRIVVGAPFMAVGGMLCVIAWFTMGSTLSQRVLDVFTWFVPGDDTGSNA